VSAGRLAALTALTLLVPAAVSVAIPEAATTEATTPPAAQTASHAAALAPSQSAAIREAVRTEMARLGIPGLSIAVVEGGALRLEEAFGYADVENDVPARAETVYRLASVSKPMTAVAVLRLHERGLLDLDAPIWRYCPDYPEKPWPVTARQLLCHQGGIRHYRPEEPVLARRFETFAEALALFRDDPLVHEPGTQVRYSTYGYNLLGCAAAGAARSPFLSLLQEAVFAPAGMSSTGPDDVRAITPHRAQGYTRDSDGRLRNSPPADMSYKLPGGGLAGTAADVARFGSALGSGRLLSPAVLEQMLTKQRVRDGRLTGYGLGLTIGERDGRREAWHTGGQERVSTVLYLDLDRGVPRGGRAIAILSNLERVQPQILALARRVSDEIGE
jgi:CubicO group peptidase (beta-lactamase class C family)